MKIKKLKGYMSVEAALVFPIVLMVVMLMMGMSFYAYNRCIVTASIYDTLLLGAKEEPDGNKSPEGQMQENLEKRLADEGISLSDVIISTQANLLEVEAKADAKVNLLWVTSTDMPIHFEDSLTKIDVIKSMRMISHGKKLLDK